jgi:hypothetical protein
MCQIFSNLNFLSFLCSLQCHYFTFEIWDGRMKYLFVRRHRSASEIIQLCAEVCNRKSKYGDFDTILWLIASGFLSFDH